MKVKFYALATTVLLLLGYACSKPNNYSNPDAEVIKEWKIDVSSAYANHQTSGPAKVNNFHMKLFSDKSITFDIFLDSTTSASDGIRTIQLNLGDPVTDGALLIDLKPRISGAYASGIVKGISASVYDTLINSTIDKYVNIITANDPSGLMRGQLNSTIVFSKNVALSGSNIVPAITTPTQGTALIRVTDNNKLFSKVTITNPDATDAVMTATINQAAAGANGPVLTTIVSRTADFGFAQKIDVSQTVLTALRQSATYVNVTSQLYPAGKLRGQIK